MLRESSFKALAASGHVTVMHTWYALLAVNIYGIQASVSQECTDVSQDVLIPLLKSQLSIFLYFSCRSDWASRITVQMQYREKFITYT